MSEPTLRTALAGSLAALGVRRTVGLDLGLGEGGLPHVEVDDPDLAVLLADADGAVNGGLGVAVLAGQLLHLSSMPGGTAFPQTVGSPEELLDTLAAIDTTMPATTALHLDLDLGQDIPAELSVGAEPERQVAYQLGSSLKGARLAVIAGAGVVRSGSGAALAGFAERLGVPVLNTVAAKGVFRWNSPYHAGTIGLQARDAELGGVDTAHVVILTGVAEGELTDPPTGNVVEIDPRQLAVAAEGWTAPADGPADRPPLYDALAAVIGPAYERNDTPLSAPRAALHLAGAAPDDGVAVLDADLAGFWVGRAFPTAVPGSVVVSPTPLPGFAAAGALMARLAGRPALGVRSGVPRGDGPADEVEAEVLALGGRLGVGVAVQAWSPDAPPVEADEHARATERDYVASAGGDAPAIRPVAVALDRLDALIEAAGEPAAWALPHEATEG
ncbi:MAG: hypothetical protein R2704_06410 [Microthrixaceae bacterium]